MFIVSKFHDYYDTAATYGIDKECIYNRLTLEHKIPNMHFPYSINNAYYSKNMIADFIPMLVGFCGKIYPVIHVRYQHTGIEPKPNDDFIYDLSRAKFEYERFGIDLNDSNRRRFWADRYLETQVGLEKFFNKDYRELEGLFRQYCVPVFMIEKTANREDKLTTNPNLKAIQFMRFKDAHSTFQEIYQYLAGVLGNREVDIVKISDKDMLKQKGFDKYSFKTMKGDKKPRAKNRGKSE